MKVVATALVLIAGAAVVLWFGNTLNSWVLGGLIGGFAALLLSIPISLTLFSYLSRRYDARFSLGAQEGATFAPIYDYSEVPPRSMRQSYVAEGYPHEMLSEEEVSDTPDDSYSNVPLIQQKDVSGRRTTTRRMYYPGFPGYEPSSFYSQQRAAALRAARREAAGQDDDLEVLPTNFSRRLPPVRRTSRSLSEQANREIRASQDLAEQQARQRYRYRRRIVDAAPTQISLPEVRESTVDQPPSQQADPQKDNLTRPLVRRAPYTYGDDALRQKLSQQPIVRRSSLFEGIHDDDDEELKYR